MLHNKIYIVYYNDTRQYKISLEKDEYSNWLKDSNCKCSYFDTPDQAIEWLDIVDKKWRNS